jgi:hypothetical protein
VSDLPVEQAPAALPTLDKRLICRTIEAAAAENDLPVDFFVDLAREPVQQSGGEPRRRPRHRAVHAGNRQLARPCRSPSRRCANPPIICASCTINSAISALPRRHIMAALDACRIGSAAAAACPAKHGLTSASLLVTALKTGHQRKRRTGVPGSPEGIRQLSLASLCEAETSYLACARLEATASHKQDNRHPMQHISEDLSVKARDYAHLSPACHRGARCATGVVSCAGLNPLTLPVGSGASPERGQAARRDERTGLTQRITGLTPAARA